MQFPSLYYIFGMSLDELRVGQIVTEKIPCICIEQNETVQNGLNIRLQNDLPYDFKDIVIEKINRFVKNQDGICELNPSNVIINKFILIQDSIYKLQGISYHNSDIKIGHFLSIVFKNDMIYFINDDSVKTSCPTRLKDETIEKKSDVLFYEKIHD